MITVTYKNRIYECTVAIQGANYIHLLDKGGHIIAAFTGVQDFSEFVIQDGAWTKPTEAYDCYVQTLGNSCTQHSGKQMCWDFDSFDFFANFVSQSTATAADSHYVHVQNTASDVWSVTHGMGKYPAVTVVDSAGSEVLGEVTHVNLNTTILSFNAAFSGKAFFN